MRASHIRSCRSERAGRICSGESVQAGAVAEFAAPATRRELSRGGRWSMSRGRGQDGARGATLLCVRRAVRPRWRARIRPTGGGRRGSVNAPGSGGGLGTDDERRSVRHETAFPLPQWICYPKLVIACNRSGYLRERAVGQEHQQVVRCDANRFAFHRRTITASNLSRSVLASERRFAGSMIGRGGSCCIPDCSASWRYLEDGSESSSRSRDTAGHLAGPSRGRATTTAYAIPRTREGC